jgi:hypothetical protein
MGKKSQAAKQRRREVQRGGGDSRQQRQTQQPRPQQQKQQKQPHSDPERQRPAPAAATHGTVRDAAQIELIGRFHTIQKRLAQLDRAPGRGGGGAGAGAGAEWGKLEAEMEALGGLPGAVQ